MPTNLSPDITERIARARADLRMGVPVVLEEGLIVLAVESLDPDRFAHLRTLDGELTLSITSRRAQTLKARAYDGDIARILLPPDATAAWVRAVADPADDLRSPMKGPLHSARDGTAHLHRAAIALVKAARLLPAALTLTTQDPAGFAAAHNLTIVPGAEVLQQRLSPLHPVISARLPLAVSEAGRLHVFRPDDGAEEHYAVEIGQPDRAAPVLSRLHSACFTGDLLGSLKCDCGPQLRGALAQMGAEGAGVLLYLNQEGRGIGLANKMRAYSLQDQGFDTVEANHRLGFEDDERDFRIGAEILKRMGFSAVRLMTNNPAKVARMEDAGITVTERVPLMVGENRHNTDYLATKASKSGHLL
ncbi:GTP cyclohydrolase II [Yoonia sediminilitoris]|uniref:GTP cyclohydrolase-2 n=1 Tax=Yoonia sediminilitoris TaxID=1286148 RepID=A0A2T6KPV7_9RHOB|nr:GTP cyclohydrolase II [Yoonia sediminilitoris]PUB18555.1 GTP cyclohydrolase II [Yoonia sediminilitoris]RCW98723.1 GTP cyclohydrolase II [Yoonia sediminilitoris]